jgi:hypothetical protein
MGSGVSEGHESARNARNSCLETGHCRRTPPTEQISCQSVTPAVPRVYGDSGDARRSSTELPRNWAPSSEDRAAHTTRTTGLIDPTVTTLPTGPTTPVLTTTTHSTSCTTRTTVLNRYDRHHQHDRYDPHNRSVGPIVVPVAVSPVVPVVRVVPRR